MRRPNARDVSPFQGFQFGGRLWPQPHPLTFAGCWMADRIFKYFSTADLISTVKELGKALASTAGVQKQLRNSNTGFLVECAILHPDEIRQRYLSGRIEIWMRGRGANGDVPDPDCAALEPTDPRLERRMNICARYC